AYKLVMVSIKYMQNQAVLRDFEDLYESMEQICIAGVGNGIGISYEIPVSVKAVYATDFAEEYVDGLVDTIIFSRGKNLCIYFKDESKPRCKKLQCEIIMPYLGTLDYQNDFQLLMNKILGRKMIKRYNIFIQNIAGKIIVSKNEYFDPTKVNLDVHYNDYVIVFMQLNDEVDDFQNKANSIATAWAEMTPLNECKDKVKALILDEICMVPEQDKICEGDSQTYYQTFYKILECAQAKSLGLYNRIVGILNKNSVCELQNGYVNGYAAGYGSPVIVANNGDYLETAIHELGHTYGLCDEGYGSGCDSECESGYSMSGGASCERGNVCCPNWPEFESIYCTNVFCQSCDSDEPRQCSYAFNFASSSYSHLQKELEKYCGE
ncbi:MAG: hypothetical protein QXO84_03775, partial [Candidatus Aenigmatarchaeota archaeon]